MGWCSVYTQSPEILARIKGNKPFGRFSAVNFIFRYDKTKLDKNIRKNKDIKMLQNNIQRDVEDSLNNVEKPSNSHKLSNKPPEPDQRKTNTILDKRKNIEGTDFGNTF